MTPKEMIETTYRHIDEILVDSERLKMYDERVKMLESDADDTNIDIANIYTKLDALEKSTLALTETIASLVNLTAKLIDERK